MISRQGSKGFFAAHYDWVALAVGVLALLGGVAFYMTSAGTDADETAAETVRNVERMKPAKTGVKPVDMEQMNVALKLNYREYAERNFQSLFAGTVAESAFKTV